MAVLPRQLKQSIEEVTARHGFSRARRHYRCRVGEGGLSLVWEEGSDLDYRRSSWYLQVWPACWFDLSARIGWEPTDFEGVVASSNHFAMFCSPRRVPPGHPEYGDGGYHPDDADDVAAFAVSVTEWFARAVDLGTSWLEHPLLMAAAAQARGLYEWEGVGFLFGNFNTATQVALLAAEGGDLVRAREAFAEIQEWSDEQPGNPLPVDIMTALGEMYPGLGPT